MSNKMRGLSSIELGLIARELTPLASAFFKSFYELKEDAFLLTLSKERRETAIYINLGKTINSTKFKEKSEAPTEFALTVRKKLEGGRVESIEQHGSDRIIEIDFTGKEPRKLIMEMFGKGNLILVNKEGLIELAYKNVSFSERSLRKGMVYSFPVLRGRQEIKHETPQKYEPRIYEKGGEFADFSTVPVAKYEEDSEIKIAKFATLSELLDALYLKERSTEISGEKSREIEELTKSLEKLRKQIEEMRIKNEDYKKVANKIFENMGEVNSLLDHVGKSKVRSVEQIGKEFSKIKIKGIDLKKRAITVDLE